MVNGPLSCKTGTFQTDSADDTIKPPHKVRHERVGPETKETHSLVAEKEGGGGGGDVLSTAHHAAKGCGAGARACECLSL